MTLEHNWISRLSNCLLAITIRTSTTGRCACQASTLTLFLTNYYLPKVEEACIELKTYLLMNYRPAIEAHQTYSVFCQIHTMILKYG
jgi:hypothetical protein